MTSIEFDAKGLPIDFDAKTFAEEGIEIPIPKDSLAGFSLTSNHQHCRCTSDSDSGCSLDEFSWVPPGLTPALVHQYMRCLPESKVPHLGSVGDRYRTMQLLKQLPVQDSNSRYCHGLSDEEKKELRIFCERRQKESLGRGVVRLLQPSDQGLRCRECNGNLKHGDVVVGATRAGADAFWHPRCFHCHKCRELLVDLIYFIKDGVLFCGRHHAETMKPRCIACDEIILSEECTEAEGQTWHMKHFTCVDCETPLGGQRYVMRDSQPLCCGCYDAIHAERCQACREVISINQGHLEINGLRWHATDACFRCDTCRLSLVGCRFMLKGDVLYCSDCAIVAMGILETETGKIEVQDDEVFEDQEAGKTLRESGCGVDTTMRCFQTGKNFCEQEFEKQCGCEFHSAFENQNDLVEGWVDIACTARNQSVKHGCTERCCLGQNSGLEKSSGMEKFGSVSISEHSMHDEQQFLDGMVYPDDELQISRLSKEEELIDMYRSQSPNCDDYIDANENPDELEMNSRALDEDFDDAENCAEISERSVTNRAPYEAQKPHMKIQKSNLSQVVSFDSEHSRKIKKSVRFDPSTKAARTPSPRDEFKRHFKQRHRLTASSQDDWNIWDQSRSHRRASGYSSDGSRSRPKPKRISGYSSDGAISKSKRNSSDETMSRPKRASGYSSDGGYATWNGSQRTHWLEDWEDMLPARGKDLDCSKSMFGFRELDAEDIEKCSTCSSSSDSSDTYEKNHEYAYVAEFDHSSTASRRDHSSSLSSRRSLTLPSVSRNAFPGPAVNEKKKGKKKNCIVS